MKCQFCNCPDSRVVDSRPTEEGSSIRRRRECINCGRRFTTYEKVEMPQLLVIKKDNNRELFDPQKIRSGIIHACHKRPVTAADIERIVAAVEQMAYNSLQEEITTKQIGERLCIAKGTVKAHTEHIYAKTDINSRKQLMDLLNVD